MFFPICAQSQFTTEENTVVFATYSLFMMPGRINVSQIDTVRHTLY